MDEEKSIATGSSERAESVSAEGSGAADSPAAIDESGVEDAANANDATGSKANEAANAAKPAGENLTLSARAVLKLLTLERIVGLLMLILIPCLMSTWVHISAIDAFGIDINLSAPETLSTSSKVIEDLEKTGDVFSEVKGMLGQAADMLEKSSEVLSVASSMLNDESGDYTEALTSALNALGDSDTAQALSDNGPQKAAKDSVDAASNTVGDMQSALEDVQSATNQMESEYRSTLETAKTVCNVLSVLWYVFMLLVFVAAVLLIVGVRGRYATSIVILAIVLVASAGTVIGVGVANNAVVSVLASEIGTWILLLFPEIVSTTAWPWVTLIISAISLVVLCVQLLRSRKQAKSTYPSGA